MEFIIRQRTKDYLTLLPNPPVTLEATFRAVKHFEIIHNDYESADIGTFSTNTKYTTEHNNEHDNENHIFQPQMNSIPAFRDFEYKNRDTQTNTSSTLKRHNKNKYMSFPVKEFSNRRPETISDRQNYSTNTNRYSKCFQSNSDKFNYHSPLCPKVYVSTTSRPKYGKK